LEETSFLTTAVLSGYLVGDLNDSRINMINAPALASEKKIELKVSKDKSIPSGGPNFLKVGAKVGDTVFTLIGKFKKSFVKMINTTELESLEN